MSDLDRTPDGHSRRIWIVDDSPTEARITRASLGDRYDIELLSDGSEVVERLAGGVRHPDMILLDWVMPGMTGDEVCRYLKSNPKTAEIPLILVTASRVETQDVVAGLAAGANDYVARPFAPEELRARVEAALRAQRAMQLAARERRRLATIDTLGRALFVAGTDVERILTELATVLTQDMCDGCSVLVLPGELPPITIARHRGDARGAGLATISACADPAVHAFANSDQARAALPPAYHPYLDRFGLRGLAILPFPVRAPVQGVITLTRDGTSTPFEPADLATIETCIEYGALAVQNAMRFEMERLARETLDCALAELPVGVIVTNAVGELTLCNGVAKALLPELVGARSLGQLYAAATWQQPDGSPLDAIDWPFGRPGRTRVEIGMQRHAARDSRMLSVSTVDLPGDATTPRTMLTAVTDVTEQRALLAEREQIAQFQQRLIGIVGHDLRNPLGAIVTGLEVLELTAEEQLPGALNVVRRLKSSSHRMSRIVDQLVDVTRATLGEGIAIEPRATPLAPLVRSVIDEIASVHPTTRFELVVRDDVVGNWDPDRLAQVITNLATNAVHYGASNAPVYVETARKDGRATIEVRNALRDKPIPGAMLEALFEPHLRGPESNRNARGLGLGLYIVKQIVVAHGGEIGARSDVSGTVFHVSLPT